ncbi:hypothetical protein BZA05DRAFT_380917 [Tricharina praecox]|uniref:uncharacterized protein n=1 Tax=Tricharina praecox TaxID=43433 RepID=UPI00221F9082|nr:uncharacterized protein BZA05DRAFT_380917 [Tricharina praecox]KAI5858341.1 hypothetical protein BZA05DRAFT_380917 [Tricharina praecox]
MASTDNLEESLERELTCSICTDLLFDPITYLDCLHTNCGACSRSWFSSQATGRNPRPTCPICREPVRETRPSVAFANLLENYLSRNPEKRRSKEEVDVARGMHKPGDKVVTEGVVVTTSGAAAAAAPTHQPRFTSPPMPPTPPRPNAGSSDWALNQPSARGPEIPRPAPPPHWGFSPSTWARQRLPSTNPDLSDIAISFGALSLNPAVSHFLSQEGQQSQQGQMSPVGQQSRMDQQHQMDQHSIMANLRPRPSGEAHWARRVPGAANTVAEVISSTGCRARIACDSCSKIMDTALHYECNSCQPYHLCSFCYNRGKRCPARHAMQPQKQVIAGAIPHLEVGLFCSICDEWLDEPRNTRTENIAHSFFWVCNGDCNDGDWHYCLRCVRRGNCCDHELCLYTNNCPTESTTSIVRGNADNANSNRTLEQRGYARWREHTARCDICHRNVLDRPASAWFHCTECADGQYDACTNCVENRGDILPGYGLCQRGHNMHILTLGDSGPGAVRILDRPEHPPPEICDVAAGEPRTAVAIEPNWSDAGEELQFPAGAEIRGTRIAFEAPGETPGRMAEWYWGTYCGRGGMFEGSTVIFT